MIISIKLVFFCTLKNQTTKQHDEKITNINN